MLSSRRRISPLATLPTAILPRWRTVPAAFRLGLVPVSLVPVVLIASVLGLGELVWADEPLSVGERIYRQQCIECHGPTGQGNEGDLVTPLVGNLSVPQLAEYIDKQMPEESPEDCTGEEAKAVAEYIYDAFYSPVAQARNQPARIELSRLTVRQYRNAVADLVGSFRRSSRLGNERGLRARYFDRDRPGGRNAALEQVDSRVTFHYGPSNLPPEELDKIKGFSARWEGSIIAAETGTYEIVLRTGHSVKLWLNDSETPLIDSWVQSGDETRHSATIFLLGGRAYPVRLDFSSRQFGVENQKKFGDEPQETFLELCWKPPHGVEELIPERLLVPEQVPELFVMGVPFPPDDRSHGYVRGTAISKAWDEATTQGAIETANYVVQHLDQLAGRSDDRSERESLYREFCRQLVERAFRRPLDEELAQRYIDRRFESAPDLETAVKRVVLLTLKSPRFLFPSIELGSETHDSYTVATTLSFALWDSLPDQPLLDAAAEGRLTSREEIQKQVERMLDDPRSRSKLREFLHIWLQLEQHADLSKNEERFPDFDGQIVADLRTSLDLFLDEVMWSEESDFRDLFRSRGLYLNGRLARFYGYDLPEEAPFQKVEPRHPQRAGVVTHPYLLAAFAYSEESSPIHRGVFLIRSVLGRALRQPPEAFSPVPADLHPDMTTRERVAMQTKAQSCQACHSLINPLGFTLEHFDAVGRFREADKEKPIDASGFYQISAEERVDFEHSADLADFLAESRETPRAFTMQLFNHMLKQPVDAYGVGMPDELAAAFEAHHYKPSQLMAEIAVKASLFILEHPEESAPAVSRTD